MCLLCVHQVEMTQRNETNQKKKKKRIEIFPNNISVCRLFLFLLLGFSFPSLSHFANKIIVFFPFIFFFWVSDFTLQCIKLILLRKHFDGEERNRKKAIKIFAYI